MPGASLGPNNDLAMRLSALERAVQGLTTRNPLNNAANIHLTGFVYTPAGAAFDITGPRVAAQLRLADGLLAFASSSESRKQNIRPSSIDPAAVLALQDVEYQYIDEVRRRDDPTFEPYVGPDYRVATEVGLIAEQLHELGLWQFVDYVRDDTGAPVLDEAGNPVPRGIHYQMLAVALLPVLRAQQAQLDALTARLNTLTEGNTP